MAPASNVQVYILALGFAVLVAVTSTLQHYDISRQHSAVPARPPRAVAWGRSLLLVRPPALDRPAPPPSLPPSPAARRRPLRFPVPQGAGSLSLAAISCALVATVGAVGALVLRPRAPSCGAWHMAAQGFGPPKAPPKTKKVKSDKGIEPCPCGSGKAYAECCQPYHAGKKTPQTPELLLRARYSAFAEKQQDFIRSTTHPEHMKLNNLTEKEFMENVKVSCNNLVYEQLAILFEEPGETEDERWITFRFWFKFIAEFKGKQAGVTRRAVETSDRQTQTERSLFRKMDGKWLFVDSPKEGWRRDSFELGDRNLTQSDVLLKVKDLASAVGQKAVDTILPKREIRLE